MHRSGKGRPKISSRLTGSTGKASQNRNRVARKIKVLLADGHALVRSGFRRIIEDEVDLTVIGETGDGVRVVQMARELKPRVVLMDYSLPQIDGLRAAEQIVKSCPRTAVLMVSVRADDNQMRSAIRAGLVGMLRKQLETWSSSRGYAGWLPVNLCFHPISPKSLERTRIKTPN
jgi:CheY-like chemotaxis protein